MAATVVVPPPRGFLGLAVPTAPALIADRGRGWRGPRAGAPGGRRRRPRGRCRARRSRFRCRPPPERRPSGSVTSKSPQVGRQLMQPVARRSAGRRSTDSHPPMRASVRGAGEPGGWGLNVASSGSLANLQSSMIERELQTHHSGSQRTLPWTDRKRHARRELPGHVARAPECQPRSAASPFSPPWRPRPPWRSQGLQARGTVMGSPPNRTADKACCSTGAAPRSERSRSLCLRLAEAGGSATRLPTLVPSGRLCRPRETLACASKR